MSKCKAEEIFKECLSNKKSQLKYDTEWDRFMKFSEFKDFQLSDITEEKVVQYIDFLRCELKLAPNTIWSCFSKINTNYQNLGGKKLQSLFPRLAKLINTYQENYVPKRAKTFSKEQINMFLTDAPDEGKFVLYKAAVCVAYYGGLRCAELVGINNDDVEYDNLNGVWVNYCIFKLSGAMQKNNRLLIPKEHEKYFLNYIEKTNKIGRIFKNFNKSFTLQPMGIRTLALVPKHVADFLKLDGNFTGHCFRRSTATILSENGASTTQLKTLMNWKSEKTALNYVDNTKNSRLSLSSMLSSTSSSNTNVKEDIVKSNNFTGATFNNCVFNLN